MNVLDLKNSDLILLQTCKQAIEQIANIDTSFLNGEGDEENYSPEEELKRIHSIVTPIFQRIVEYEVDKKEEENII